jgi:hypothetical protein
VSSGARLRLTVRDGGSGVDPTSLFARVDGRYRTVAYDARRGLVEVLGGRLPRGRHSLLVSASDYQETKNNENGAKTLPNTRRLATSFLVR